MDENKIFIFEFVSGGGFNKLNIPPNLFPEGYGMLRAIIADFELMNFEIITILDYRINFLSKYLKADHIEIVNKRDNYKKKFDNCIKDCEFCFIIAPEFSNILYNLTNIARKKKKKILSADLEGIKLGTSKVETYNYFKQKKIPTPRTFLIPFKRNQLDKDFIIHKFNQLNNPIIIKPLDGVGAESIYYFEHLIQIKDFFEDYSIHIDLKRHYILQEFVSGDDLSVSLVGRRKSGELDFQEPIILSINSQKLDIRNSNHESEYLGGTTPVKDYLDIKKELDVYMKKNNFQIDGYYGVDFIRINNKELKFIEINPRLTTSYLGIRNIVNINPVEMIYETKINGDYETEFNIVGHSIFSRLELKYIGNHSINQIYEIEHQNLLKIVPELITPPIYFSHSINEDEKIFSCFISTNSKTDKDSQKRFKEIIEKLREYNFLRV